MTKVNAKFSFEGAEVGAGYGEWVEPTELHANLEALGGTNPPVGVRLESTNVARLRSGVRVKAEKTVAGGEKLFRLPEGYRPATGVTRVLGTISRFATGLEFLIAVQVNTAGTVTLSKINEVSPLLTQKDEVFFTLSTFPVV